MFRCVLLTTTKVTLIIRVQFMEVTMKQSPICSMLLAAVGMFFCTLPMNATAQSIADSLNFAPVFSTAHKLKKQSTGSKKRLTQKHDHVAKQKKEKKWHKKAETLGQGGFAPKKYRK